LVQELIEQNPNSAQGHYWLGRFYAKQREANKGLELLNRWLTKRPGDQEANTLLQQLRGLANVDSLKQRPAGGDSAAQ
jgi:hypothetical protein